MGFSSFDDYIQETTANGKFWRADWNKLSFGTTAHTAGLWYLFSGTGGNPPASTLLGAGTNLSLQAGWHDVASGGGGIQHGGAVSPDTKHILNASAYSASATTVPCVMMLVDLLAHYPITSVTTTGNQTLINSITFTADSGTEIITHTGYDIATYSRVQVSNSGGGLPGGLSAATDYWTVRQSASTSKLATSLANAVAGTTIDITSNGTGTQTVTVGLPRYSTGAGVQAFLCPSTVMGAGTPTCTVGYTNSAGTASRATPSSPALPTVNTTSPVSQVSHSGTGAGKYGPFIPLQAGDAGVRSAQTVNFSATMTSGVQNLVLAKPLLTLPITTLGVAAERELLSQIPSAPQVYDGACLAWMFYAGAATPVSSPFYGHLDFGWG